VRAAVEMDMYAVQSVRVQVSPEKRQVPAKNPICLRSSNAIPARAQGGSFASFVKGWERYFQKK
jgi:hypothetical protein